MSSVRSPHVVFFYGACVAPVLCMTLEFCHKGSLHDCLNSPIEVINWPRILKVMESAAKGINCLHCWKPQIVHRDLKSLNLLVDENWNVKVGDFGLSRFTSGAQLSTLGKLRGTYAYCAPEIYFGKAFSPKSDIYSMGVIFWELVVRCIKGSYEQPYSEFPNLMFPFQIIIQTAKNNLRPSLPENCPEFVDKLIKRSWHSDVEQRPATQEFIDEMRGMLNEYKDNKEAWDKVVAPFFIVKDEKDS